MRDAQISKYFAEGLIFASPIGLNYFNFRVEIVFKVVLKFQKYCANITL